MNAQKPSRLDAAADRLLSLDSVVYGDERERRVVLEACSFGWTIGAYLPLAGAVVVAALGHPIVSLIVLLMGLVPLFAAQWYGKRRQVDFAALAARDPRLTRRVAVAQMVLVIAWCALLYHQGATGRGLISIPAISEDISTSTLKGMGIGGVFGGIAGLLAQAVAQRRSVGRRLTDGTEPDDEF